MTISVSGNEPGVIFRDELPVPKTNIEIYERLYVLEQWFRRVAYASLMARYGSNWKSALPPELLGDLKRRLKQLDGRMHLHCENSNNAIWVLTLEELRTVLLSDNTWPTVRVLTGLPRGVVDTRLDELREIRNVVGHSRATSGNTLVVLNGLATGLTPGIERFKTHLLYSVADAIHLEDDGDDGYVFDLYAQLVANNDWSSFQPVLSSSKLFYSLTHLPVAPFDRCVRVKRFLADMSTCENEILAVLVNKLGDEFTLTWPRALSDVEHDHVVRFFFSRRVGSWTSTPYVEQSPEAICDPRVWFYENQRPESE